MTGLVRRLALSLLVCLVPACSGANPDATTTIAPTTRTVRTAPVEALKWGQVGPVKSGVTVQVFKPQPVNPPTSIWFVPTDAPAGNRRELVCDVVVHNQSKGDVRIGLSGMAGLVELIPKHETVPTVLPGSTSTIRRTVLAPAENWPITIQISATVDGVSAGLGWTFVGGMA